MLIEALDRIELTTGDLTELPVEAIVNAANPQLAGGGGVDGAIHQAAGPELLAYTREHFPGGCPTGLAVVTPAFGLTRHGAGTIRHIIHTVGPVWPADGDPEAKLGYTLEDTLLASCYTRSLALAQEHGCVSLAFPAISTGVYGFPKNRAAKIAFGHVLGHLARQPLPERVVLCSYSEADAAVIRDAIATRDRWMYNRRRA